MTLLFRIVRAVHANGTHHKLALDALTHLETADKDRWQRLFLSQAGLYLEGSKAPDKEFKDFKNHVLHVRDGLWGGAPAKARSWYNHLVEALSARNWEMAIYCAGVLSHYYTDPIQPFHTAQSIAESNIHRAAEWSISKSYDELRAEALPRYAAEKIELCDDPNWLAEFVVAGATHSNQHYEALIAHYDINKGVVDPPAGLDKVAQKIIGELLVYAAMGFAAILDRAISEAGVAPPKVGLSVKTVLAGLAIPLKWVTNKLADGAEAALVKAMYDELQETGRVEINLPEDDRVIRDLYNAEIASKLTRVTVSERFPLPRRSKTGRRAAAPIAMPKKAAAEHQAAPPKVAEAQVTLNRPAPQGSDNALDTAAPTTTSAVASAPTPAGASAITSSSPSLQQALAQLQPRPMPDNSTARPSVRPLPSVPSIFPKSAAQAGRTMADDDNQDRRYHLSIRDDIVDAPSIGPKTAVRLRGVGLLTVADLLACNPAAIAGAINMRHITKEALVDWQDQARLVCTVPGLRGTHAQILVGAGYRDPETIAQTEQTILLADILHFARTPAGQRVLRDGQPPKLEKVLGWIQQAGQANTARAA